MTKESESKDLSERQVDDILSNQDATDELAQSNLVSDEALLSMFSEIMSDVRDDKKQIGELLDDFVEMVINDGDSTTSSKEAMVSLAKLKSDQSDKAIKIADLMTRIKLKEANTWKPYMGNKNQGTNLTIIDQTGMTKKEILDSIKKKEGNDK
jgi:hypothetical protein